MCEEEIGREMWFNDCSYLGCGNFINLASHCFAASTINLMLTNYFCNLSVLSILPDFCKGPDY